MLGRCEVPLVHSCHLCTAAHCSSVTARDATVAASGSECECSHPHCVLFVVIGLQKVPGPFSSASLWLVCVPHFGCEKRLRATLAP